MRDVSLDAAINSTQKVGNKVKQLFLAGKLGRSSRSSSYFLESSRLQHSTGTNVSRKSSWLEQSAGLVGAMLATVSITMADILWMIPYITNEVTGRWNSLFFVVLLQVLATLSILLADEEDQSLKRDSHAQRWIDVASAALLWLYAFYLYLDEHVFQKALAAEPEATPESEALDETCCDTARGTTKYSRGSFVVLALLNSVDQVIVFVPLVSTGMVTAMELQVGVLISSTLSIAACFAAGQLTCVVDTIKAIPLWLLVTFVGVGAFVGGFVSA